jgi:hypothetical protein
MTGLTRESINKHLSSWRDNGWITFTDGAITLVNLEALQALLVDHAYV